MARMRVQSHDVEPDDRSGGDDVGAVADRQRLALRSGIFGYQQHGRKESQGLMLKKVLGQ